MRMRGGRRKPLLDCDEMCGAAAHSSSGCVPPDPGSSLCAQRRVEWCPVAALGISTDFTDEKKFSVQ